MVVVSNFNLPKSSIISVVSKMLFFKISGYIELAGYSSTGNRGWN